MDLERVAAVIRPREPYEAIDLGFGLARQFARQVWLPWFMCVLPLQLLVIALTWPLGGWLALFLLWWLKPLFDRVPLFVLSRALFGATPRVRDVVRAFPRLMTRQVFWALTVQRIDLRRAFRLPVWELEGLPYRQRGRRLQVLDRGQEGPAFVLSFVSAGMQWGITLGLFWLVDMLIPSQVDLHLFQELGRGIEVGFPTWLALLCWTCYLLADAIAAPLHVAGGFALYINRRTHLEGWDVQLAFQRLAKRLEALEDPTRRGASGRLGIVAALLLCLALAPAGAQELEDVPIGPEPSASKSEEPGSEPEGPDPGAALRRVYQREEFGGSKTVRSRQWRSSATPNFQPLGNCGLGSCNAATPGGLQGLCMLISSAMGVALVIGLVAWLFRYRARLALMLAAEGAPKQSAAGVVPEELMGLDLRAESLPADIARAAEAALAAGDVREALSLLYRGALAQLIPSLELKIDASATEGDCLAAVKAARGPSDWFAQLTAQWQLVAYAHREAERSAVSALCVGYRDAIGERRRRK